MLALGGTQPPDLEQRMEERFAQMHARIGQLEQRNDRLEAENDNLRKAPRSYRAVSPSGEVEGRRMSATSDECCRWTPDGTCTPSSLAREKACTMVHEYLETKTTTHSFADITDCAGADESNWGAEFNGVTGNVTLKNSASVQSSFPTPLKVTHSSSCTTGVQPTLDLQLDTNVAGSFSVQGVDLTSTLQVLSANLLPTYAQYPGWACANRNEVKSSTDTDSACGGSSACTFTACQAICHKESTCVSFEYKSNSATPCMVSNSCTPALGKSSPTYTCLPTPPHMCPRSLPAFAARVRCLRSFSLRSHAPGAPADAQPLPCANQRTLAAHPIARREHKCAISRSSSGAWQAEHEIRSGGVYSGYLGSGLVAHFGVGRSRGRRGRGRITNPGASVRVEPRPQHSRLDINTQQLQVLHSPASARVAIDQLR